MQVRNNLLAAGILLVLLAAPALTNYRQAGAQSLPDYCSDENGQTTCTIKILGLQDPPFSPRIAEVPLGAKIIVENVAPEIHTITSTDNAFSEPGPEPNGIFDTGILKTGQSASFVMDKAGEFYYYCAVHPEDMRGKIVVAGSTSSTVAGSTSSTVAGSTSSPATGSSPVAAKSVSQDTELTGGELPITKISSVGDEAYIIDGTTPKGGHDAFSYDGSGHKEITGHIQVDLNPQGKAGKIVATWTDQEGHDWRLEQSKFSGGNELYIGEVNNGTLQTRLASDPIGINHFEHGTTGAGPVVEPTLFVYLASWGPAEVWKDGESQGTFEAHMMVTDGARDPVSGKIVKSDGTTPYSPMAPGDSKVNPYAAQLHLVFHTPAGNMTNNFPPPYQSFTHLMFYNLDPPLPVTHFKADNAYIIDGTTPKGGHDAFSYDGSGHKKLQSGDIAVKVDPETKTGTITAQWTDDQGNTWELKQSKFSGGNELYVGETKDNETEYSLAADPVAINHFEHGSTGAGPVVEPTLFVYLATWGPAEVWKNGESVGTFEAHMMVTDGPRDPVSGRIVKSDGTTPYSPMTPGDSKVNPYIAQAHLVFHTPAGNMTNNFPPPYQSFTHLMFYNIRVLSPDQSEVNSELDGKTYTITAMSSDTSLITVKIEPNDSVQLKFDSPGEVELTLPTAMISGISSVTSDGNDISFEKVDASDNATTIRFSVPSSGTAEIRGTTVVPEFGVIAALVLAVSIVGVVLLSRSIGQPHQRWRF